MDDTEHLGWFASYPADWLAKHCFVNVRTARRWRRARTAPTLIVRWLTLVYDGVLGALHKDWEGWTLREGKLYDPVGRWHTPATLTADHLRMQLNSALNVRVRRLQDELATALARLDELTALAQPIALANTAGRRAPLSHVTLSWRTSSPLPSPVSLVLQLPQQALPRLALSPPG